MTSNVSGFLKAVGLSRTTTLVTLTMDIFFELCRAALWFQNKVSPNAFREMAEVFQIFGCPPARNGDSKLGDVGGCGEGEGGRALLPMVVMQSSV